MRAWLKLLFPLVVWGLHFTGLYLATEFLPEWSVLAAVLLTSLGIAALLAFWTWHRRTGGLTRTSSGLGSLLSLTAITAQCLPFIIVP